MRLLRQIWKIIDPHAAIGADTQENRDQKELNRRLRARKLAQEIRKMERKVANLRRIGRLDKLSRGEKVFLREHKIDFLA
jgi:hypothetical protein